MRRPLLLTPILMLAVVLVWCPRPAAGCAVAGPEGGTTTIRSESALIVYDSATKTEHFIRTADFRSTSAEFGFLVPTPSKPELGEASTDVFQVLEDITERRTEVRIKWKPFGVDTYSNQTFSSIGSAIKPDVGERTRPAVTVVEQKRVGRYEAAVLQADEPNRLRDWLSKNGYAAPPALEKWFEPYTSDGWFLTAFKIAGDAAGDLSSAAVRISFPTDRPFYPYREPANMQSVVGSRALKLFVLSDSRVSGTIGKGDVAKAWAGKTEWSNKVPADKLAAAVAKGKLPESVGGREWHLTEFLDPSSPRPGTDEVYFEKSADQSNVERPPHIVWEEYNPWPWVFGGVGVLILVALGVAVWRMVRTKA